MANDEVVNFDTMCDMVFNGDTIKSKERFQFKWDTLTKDIITQKMLQEVLNLQLSLLGATSMPNDTFWAPNLAESAPTFTMNLQTRDVETASRHQRASTHSSRDISKTSNKLQAKSKGAGGMGEALRYIICYMLYIYIYILYIV